MNKSSLLLASAIALSFATPAFAADKETYKSETKVEKDAKGNYNEKVKTEKTDMSGTTTSVEKKVDVDADADGTDATVKTETVTDPKGLMNKTTVKTTDTQKTHSDGTAETTHKKTVNGKTVESESSKH